ncbi:MAG TPA: DUF2934 domain-containing protein [Polyangiaceae bacterium]|nr:DUF2934 domain-containing protein [Polyangiaceae bacterium]
MTHTVNRDAMSIEPHAIRARAYELWNERGRPDGSADHDWLRAEQELMNRLSAKQPAATALPETSGATVSTPVAQDPTQARAAVNKTADKPSASRAKKSSRSKVRDVSAEPGAAAATRLLAKLATNARA